MPEMFQTKHWDELMEKYRSDLVGANLAHVVPTDIQVKVGPFEEYEDAEGNVIGVEAEADLPKIDCKCSYGAIIQAENDRLFAFLLDEQGMPAADLSEVEIDDTDLTESHVILKDNAIISATDGDCPNAYKNKKFYKESNAPIKIQCYDADTRQILYTVLVRIRYPTDPLGHQQPPLHYSYLPAIGSHPISPYALIVMSALVFIKPDCIRAPPTPETECDTSMSWLLQ